MNALIKLASSLFLCFEVMLIFLSHYVKDKQAESNLKASYKKLQTVFEKGTLKNFVKFTGKHFRRIFFFNKVAGYF